MASGITTQATLDYLARRLNEVAAQLPTTHAEVDPAALTDDIALLAHHLTYTSERAQERFAAPETVYLPERHTLIRLAEAMSAVTGAMGHLTEALHCVSTGFTGRPPPGWRPPTCTTTPRRCGSSRPRSAAKPALGSPPPPQRFMPRPLQQHLARGRPCPRRPSRPPSTLHSPPPWCET
ncbi:hypothetical protein ACIBAG_27520 [Streptomyces sp. NPDC051243]|uniref:hypothetical protein n=1 Tax=Streptomyces sp. NPDC051243 TaxID=3365646 RepID=UPI003787E6DD